MVKLRHLFDFVLELGGDRLVELAHCSDDAFHPHESMVLVVRHLRVMIFIGEAAVGAGRVHCGAAVVHSRLCEGHCLT